MGRVDAYEVTNFLLANSRTDQEQVPCVYVREATLFVSVFINKKAFLTGSLELQCFPDFTSNLMSSA
jgi:hypothetical protein